MSILEDFEFTTWTHSQSAVSIDYPSQWTVKVEPEPGLNVTFVSPPDDGVSLRMQFLPILFPVSLFESRQQLLDTLDRMVQQDPATELLGRSNLLPYPASYGRLVTGDLLWVTMHLDRLAMIQTAGDPAQREHFQPVFERMVRSFRIHPTEQSDLSMLLGEVIMAMQALAPDASPQLAGDYIQMGAMQVRADNLLANIRNAPEHRQVLVSEFVRTTVRTWRSLSAIAEISWENARKAIYPMVRPASILKQHHGDESELSKADQVRRQVLHQPWLGNLVICYAIDSERTLRFVLNHDLERWGLDAPVVQQQAMRNLENARGLKLSVHQMEGKMVVGKVEGEELPAISSWILHPNLYKAVRRVWTERVWAALPSRDELMVFPAQPKIRPALELFLKHQFRNAGNPLSDKLFAIEADGVVLA